MMAQYPDVFIMTFSIHIVLLSQTAQLLLIFCYAAPLYGVAYTMIINLLRCLLESRELHKFFTAQRLCAIYFH